MKTISDENIKKIIQRVFEYELYPEINMPVEELMKDVAEFATIYDGDELPDYIKNSVIVIVYRTLKEKIKRYEERKV